MATLFLGKKHGAAGFTRHVAIKVVHEHLASDPDFVRMFVDEALLQARIQNPHVVHVEELGEADGAHFMVMEYVHGCALAQLLLALSKRKRRPQVEIAVSIALQTLAGLHAAHELRADDGSSLGVVHRDVSPQNVLLSRDGHVKLIDFGVAKAASSLNQTQGAMIKGKIRYMPPEQAFGKTVDRRADLYALGIVLWEMLTMRKLFGAQDDLALLEMVRDPKIDPPSRWASEVPPALDRVVLKALSKDPAQRYATAQDMRRALAEAVPASTMVEASSIAELLEASLGNELEKERKALPAAVGAQVGPSPDRTRVIEERAEEVLLTLTVSAAGLEVKSDIAPISGSMSDFVRTSDPQISMSPALLPPGATPPPSPVSSVPVGTPSQVHSLTGPMMIGPPMASSPPGPSRVSAPVAAPRSFAMLAAVTAVLVIALAGGGTYLWRQSSTSDEMVVSPLPVGPSAAGPSSDPVAVPSVATTPAPIPTTTGAIVDGSDIAPRPETTAIEPIVAEEIEAEEVEVSASAPATRETPRTERREPVVRRRRDRGSTPGGTVPFSTEF